ncbi:MAG: hypothetical protein NTW30_05625 [Candidatus Aenigmarchaeota archaeon]|nr:hypothetical protein [Candidatus Aenigmarchaeota archaeon]
MAADAQAAKSLEDELSLEAPKAGDNDIESLKARLAKAEEERENYKKGMLKYKSASKGNVGDEEGDEAAEAEEKPQFDVKSIAESAATGVIEKNNEKLAISQFTEKYPALKDPTVWAKVVENFNSKNGKGTVDSIKQDLEAALILAKHYGGGRVAEKEISLNNFASVSYAGSIAPHSASSEVKDSTIEMGRMMGVSADALEKASQPGANEIHLN